MSKLGIVAVMSVLVVLVLKSVAFGHCDTLDGPVVQSARDALQKADVVGVLKWVRSDDEKEVRQTFDQALKVRGLGVEARELADRHFFETLVRLHRAGEGMAYTGLKPAGTIDPGIAAADRALANGSVESLADELGKSIATTIRERFSQAKATRSHAEESPAAGRAFVAAYVQFVHFVESVHKLTTASVAEHHDHAHRE